MQVFTPFTTVISSSVQLIYKNTGPDANHHFTFKDSLQTTGSVETIQPTRISLFTTRLTLSKIAKKLATYPNSCYFTATIQKSKTTNQVTTNTSTTNHQHHQPPTTTIPSPCILQCTDAAPHAATPSLRYFESQEASKQTSKGDCQGSQLIWMDKRVCMMASLFPVAFLDIGNIDVNEFFCFGMGVLK